jgi:hypothetical protein
MLKTRHKTTLRISPNSFSEDLKCLLATNGLAYSGRTSVTKKSILQHQPLFWHAVPGNPHKREEISTADLLLLTSSHQLLFMLKQCFDFFKTTNLNEEVNGTESCPSVRVPWAQ